MALLRGAPFARGQLTVGARYEFYNCATTRADNGFELPNLDAVRER